MRFAALLLMLSTGPLWAADTIRIAVAANFKPTLEQINQDFQAKTGIEVTLSSASTGMLATQISHGAPFDIFFSADQTTPMKHIAMLPDREAYAFCNAVGGLALAGGKSSLQLLLHPDVSLAIANPVTAPYGRAAMQVLSREEFSAGKARKLVRGNNAIQAFQFWHSGSVDLAIIPRSLAPGTATPIPLNWHQSLEQYAVVLVSKPIVDTYLNWIRSDTVRTLITQAGYEPCP
jgi:molybdate transport system substrate-binding protein